MSTLIWPVLGIVLISKNTIFISISNVFVYTRPLDTAGAMDEL